MTGAGEGSRPSPPVAPDRPGLLRRIWTTMVEAALLMVKK